MKQLLKSAKSICALVLSIVLIMTMSTVAFAADKDIDTEEEISAVLARINAEFGTNIHVLSESELARYGFTAAESQAAKSCEPVDLEVTLRYIAEVQIPKFKQTTQEAKAIITNISTNTNLLSTSANPVIATKAIDYATAAVEAYITTDSYGNTVWGNILRSYCDTNMYQSTCFVATNTTATYMDGRRTIYWTGDGDYIAYLNGSHYYLYSGTQSTSMYVGNYD